MKVADVKILRQDAALMAELSEKKSTPEGKKNFMNAMECWKDKYPHYKWEDWAPKERGR